MLSRAHFGRSSTFVAYAHGGEPMRHSASETLSGDARAPGGLVAPARSAGSISPDPVDGHRAPVRTSALRRGEAARILPLRVLHARAASHGRRPVTRNEVGH